MRPAFPDLSPLTASHTEKKTNYSNNNPPGRSRNCLGTIRSAEEGKHPRTVVLYRSFGVKSD